MGRIKVGGSARAASPASSTPQVTSSPLTNGSTKARGSSKNTRSAAATASASLCAASIISTPIADPPQAGFTTRRLPRRVRNSLMRGSSGSPRSSSASSATGMPAARSWIFACGLLAASALAITAEPTYGKSSTSSAPCRQPSSPSGP
ncbi:MAG: hypothetical protein QM756_15705 [Polyangiaceae bacterium]